MKLHALLCKDSENQEQYARACLWRNAEMQPILCKNNDNLPFPKQNETI